MNWLKKLLGAKSPASPDQGDVAKHLSIPNAWQQHQEELQRHLDVGKRQATFMIWRTYIDTHAHDFIDLVASSEHMEQITAMEVDIVMRVYIAGYMAKQEWIDPMEAHQMPFRLGRQLRDYIRGLGLSLETLNANIGVQIDHALGQVLQAGLSEQN